MTVSNIQLIKYTKVKCFFSYFLLYRLPDEQFIIIVVYYSSDVYYINQITMEMYVIN